MSILNTNPENFEIRLGDIADHIYVGLTLRHKQRTFYGMDYEMNALHKEYLTNIKNAIAELGCIEPTGVQIRRIIKDVVGFAPSVRRQRSAHRRGQQLEAWYAATTDSTDRANRICDIPTRDSRYVIRYLNISIQYNKTAPVDEYMF